jgi:hypothetical protein
MRNGRRTCDIVARIGPQNRVVDNVMWGEGSIEDD